MIMGIEPGTGTSLVAEFLKAASQGPTIYFAPLLGAFVGIASQWRKSHSSDRVVLHKSA